MPSNLPHYALRIALTTMDRLKYIAYENGRSANKEIEQLIIKHIKQYETEYGEITLDDLARMRDKI